MEEDKMNKRYCIECSKLVNMHKQPFFWKSFWYCYDCYLKNFRITVSNTTESNRPFFNYEEIYEYNN